MFEEKPDLLHEVRGTKPGQASGSASRDAEAGPADQPVAGASPAAPNRYLQLLLDGKEQIAAAFAISRDAICLHVDGLFRYMNPAFAAMFGAKNEAELLGQPFIDRVHPNSRAIVTERVRSMREHGRGLPCLEEEFLRVDGTPFVLEVSAVPVVIDGRPGGLVLGRNVTEEKHAERARKAVEAALDASQAQLACAMELAGLVSWKLDVAAGEYTFNDRFYALLGTTAEREGGYVMDRTRYLREFVHPDDLERATAPNGEFPANPLQSGPEHRVIRRDGRVLDVMAMAQLRHTPDGKTEIYGALQDITERKQAERSLQEMAAQLRLTLHQAPVGIALASFDGRYLLTNAAFCRFLGYSEEELRGRQLSEFINPAYDTIDWDRVHQRLLSHEIDRFSGEKCYRRRDGAAIWGRVSVEAVFDAQQRPLYLLGVVEDITGHKRAEAKLAESQLKLSTLFGSTGDFIWVVDPIHFTYTAFNERVSEYHTTEGITLRAGMRPDEVFTKERATLWEGLYERALKSGNFESRQELAPHSTVIQASFHLLRQNGRVLGIMVFGRDVTAQEKAEREQAALEAQLQQAQKMESIGRLAGGVAHDFNNLLTVIKGYAELALPFASEGKPVHTSLSEILKAGNRASALTSQLLAFSRKQLTSPELTNVNEFAADLLNMLQRLVGDPIHIETKLDPALGVVLVDRSQLVQVVMNLAANARDAMPDGGTLTIETANARLDPGAGELPSYPEAKPGSYVLLQVSDTGTGIEEEVRQHIFEPFFTTKKEGKGTGLGLATVYGIVRQCGGWISVYSELGRGTTFKVYLPRTDQACPSPAPQPAPAASLRGSETILVVEDRTDVRRFVVTVLEKCGYQVLEASSGEGAFTLLSGHSGPLHLILTDAVLPHMNGHQIMDELRRQRPELRVLYMSGYSRETAMARGVVPADAACLSKPFGPDELAAAVRRALQT
jgi:two-component system, cell cycle sensor histidine kinase and response regulator CckA